MSYYRKIYTDIEAVIWEGRNYSEMLDFVYGVYRDKNPYYTFKEIEEVPEGSVLEFVGSSGPSIVKPGDYMVKTPTGCCYPLMKEHFEKAYALIED